MLLTKTAPGIIEDTNYLGRNIFGGKDVPDWLDRAWAEVNRTQSFEELNCKVEQKQVSKTCQHGFPCCSSFPFHPFFSVLSSSSHSLPLFLFLGTLISWLCTC